MAFTVHGLGGEDGPTLVFDEGDGCPMVLLPEDVKAARPVMHRLVSPTEDFSALGKLRLGDSRMLSIDKSACYTVEFDDISAVVLGGSMSSEPFEISRLAIFGKKYGKTTMIHLDPRHSHKLVGRFMPIQLEKSGEVRFDSDRVIYRLNKGSRLMTLRIGVAMTANGSPLHAPTTI